MKFNIDGKERHILINGKKQTKTIKKAKLSDKGKNLNQILAAKKRGDDPFAEENEEKGE